MSTLPRIDCDACGVRADTVHLLPWVNGCERVEFCCSDHDAGGYWFELERLWPEGDIAGGYGMLRHIAESKWDGWHAVALLAERLSTLVARDDERFHLALRRKQVQQGADPDSPVVDGATFLSVDRAAMDAVGLDELQP
jgi:hypothetical protein